MNKILESDSLEDLQKDADSGDAVAMYHLAEHLAKSEDGGVTPNLEKALGYLRKSSDAGYKPASYRLYRIQAGYAILTTEYHETTLEYGQPVIMLFGNSPFDEIKKAEQLIIGIDYNKADKYLSLVTSSDKVLDNNACSLNDDNQLLIKGKISWSEEYSNDNYLKLNLGQSASLVTSILEYVQTHIIQHLDSIDHLNIDNISSEQKDLNYFLLESMWRLLKVLFVIYNYDIHLVSRELIDRSLLIAAKLKAFPELINQRAQDIISTEEKKEYHSPTGIFNDATRYNPDGDNCHNSTAIKDLEYIIELDKYDGYQIYVDMCNPSSFYPRSLENSVLDSNSINALLESGMFNDLKNMYLNRYIPDLTFTYHYSLLLKLNGQNEEALVLYNDVIGIYRNLHRTANEKEQKLNSKFKNLVNSAKVLTFEDYKQNIVSEIMVNDPCYLYESGIIYDIFDQELYEKCNFPIAQGFSHFHINSNDSIFDCHPHSVVAKCTESLAYISVLSKGGVFLGHPVTENKARATNLSELLSDAVINNIRQKEQKVCSVQYISMRVIHDIYPSFLFFSDPILNANYIELMVGKQELVVPEFDDYFQNGGDMKSLLASGMEFRTAGPDIPVNEPITPDGERTNIAIIKQYIMFNNNSSDVKYNRYYAGLIDIGHECDDKSNHQTLSRLLYQQKGYSIEPNEILRSFKEMTSEIDFYYGTHENYSSTPNYPYIPPYGVIYPINYEARKEFSRFFIDMIVPADKLVHEVNDPFQAYICIMLLKMADQWKNSNADIMTWLSSKHFKELEDSPYENASVLEDNSIINIVKSLKGGNNKIDFYKAIEIDDYNNYCHNIDKYISAATDGGIKIPEILFMRALLYLNMVTSNTDDELVHLIDILYKKHLEIDVMDKPDVRVQTAVKETKSVQYPFLSHINTSSEHEQSVDAPILNSTNINKSIRYLDYLLLKNREGEFVYACHPDLISDAFSLKLELEKELHIRMMSEINIEKMELEVQKAKQKAAIEKEREMLSFLTHTLRNSLANGPAQLKQSIRLLGTEDYEKSNSKYKAINNIVSQLSTFSVVNTLITTFKQYVGDQESFTEQWFADNQGKADIDWVVSFCLRQCISRALFFPNYQRVIKRLIKDDSASFIKETRKNYIENILSLTDDDKPTEKIHEWTQIFLPKINIDIDSNSPAFAVNNVKFTYLFSIFSEVIWNAFKHTDAEHSIDVSWKDNKDHYLFTVDNHYVEEEINLESSTNKGLIFIARLLSMFDDASIVHTKNGPNSFAVSISLPYNVFS